MSGAKHRALGAMIGLAVLSACSAGGLSRPQIAQVNGFSVKVTQLDRDPPTYSAAGASARDRARLDNAYYARNIIAIRQVAGCPIKPELIRHDTDGPESTATVVC